MDENIKITENWYIILGLEFDPNPIEDEKIIEQRIEEKKKFWSRESNNFKHGAEYRKYSQKIPIIKKQMLGDENIRKALIKDACEKTYKPIDNTLKLIKKNELPSDTIERVAEKYKVNFEIVEKRAKLLGIKIISSKSDYYKKIYETYYENKPKNADKYNGIKELLETFGVKDLYEFLYQKDSSIKNAYNLPCNELKQKAIEKKKKEFYRNDSTSGTGSKICGQCEDAFKDDSSKQLYDEYLSFNKRRKILDEIKEMYEITKEEFSLTSYNAYIEELTKLLKNPKLSEDLLRAFCIEKKIPIAVSKENTYAENSNIKVCRCGVINDVSDGRKVCKNCGLELQIKCPKCGIINDVNIKVCKCGFKFENIDKANSLCELASEAIDNIEFSVAKAYLSDADRYWPNSEKVKSLKEKLSNLEKRIGNIAEVMKSACEKKNYYEAKKQYLNIKKIFPKYLDTAIEEEINLSISNAETFKKKAQTSKVESEIIEACIKAYESCRDYPGIKEIISKYPPSEPRNLVVSPNSIAKANTISWNKSSSTGLVFYSVVRKEGTKPISVEDGTLIGRLNMCSITDRSIVSGVQYYYAVFAERGGVFSKGLVTERTIGNFFEISNVTVVSGDGLLQFSWSEIPENAEVNIARIVDGKEQNLNCNNKISFVDKGLVNDIEYKYHIFLSYISGVEKVFTKGLYITGKPISPPKSVEKLFVKYLENDKFEINWEDADDEEIQFYFSESLPDFLCGDLISLTKLESNMRSLIIKKTSNKSGIFNYSKENLIYIVGVIVKNGSVVIGKIARASKGGAVKIKNVNLVNGKILISINFPKNATGFVVLYRSDHFPEDITDINAKRKYIPLKQYEYDSGLIIDSNESQNYYFSVYAEFNLGGEKNYSSGTDYLFSNISKEIITYSVKVNKRIFGKNEVVLEFESENKKFLLPAIDIMSSIGSAPMFKKSAELFYEIESKQVDGTFKENIPFKKVPKDTYIKVFLKDENLKNKYQLKLKVNSDLKIS